MAIKDNILLVANWESNVGYAWWLMENFWITISRHFSRQGSRCHLIYPRITQLPESIAASNIKTSECDFRDRSTASLGRLRRIIRGNSIRHVYLSDSPPYDLYYLLLRLWGVRNIVVHDHTPGERTPPIGLLKHAKSVVQRTPYFTADHFIAVTDYVHKRHIEVNRIPARKCSIAPNGIIPIDLENTDRFYAYNELGIPKDRLIVVTTGRACYYKGIDFFLECANELVNNQGLRQLHFLFCGDGPDMEDFRAIARRLHVVQHVTFAGKRNDVRKLLPCCKIGIHAAAGEVGYSLSILEYMSAGLVTIVPDNPSTSLATLHMENGILYTQRNLKQATAAIKTALDPIIADQLTTNAIRTVNERFSIDNTNQTLIEILDHVFGSSVSHDSNGY